LRTKELDGQKCSGFPKAKADAPEALFLKVEIELNYFFRRDII